MKMPIRWSALIVVVICSGCAAPAPNPRQAQIDRIVYEHAQALRHMGAALTRLEQKIDQVAARAHGAHIHADRARADAAEARAAAARADGRLEVIRTPDGAFVRPVEAR
jgi:outer membrane murein-binding lipoprotein Lpp